MSNIIPIRGFFESAKALLIHISHDEEIESFVFVAIRKDGCPMRAQFEMTRANMAYCSLILAEWCREDEGFATNESH